MAELNKHGTLADDPLVGSIARPMAENRQDETAEELWRAGTWRDMEPEQAAAAWIDLGAPAGERRDSPKPPARS